MNTLKLKKGIHWIGIQDHKLRVFDVIMHTEFGTSYNAYLVEGTQKTALIETVKVKFWDDYLAKLQNCTDLAKIDYIIVNHTEPDHAGSIEKLLNLIPNVTILGSAAAIKFLKAITNKEFNSQVITGHEKIDLGGKTLKFIQAPFLHWPDSIYTYAEEDHILFTCDSFGAHYAFDGVLLSKIIDKTDYKNALKYYFDMIMGPFKPYMLSAIEKIQNLELKMICTGHGPILDQNPMEIVDQCREWSTEENPNTKKSIVIPYVSAYGYTEMLAIEIKRGIDDLFAKDIDVTLFDMVEVPQEEFMDRIYWADGILFGSPTINGDALPPIWNLLISLNPIVHGKKHASAFGSYGWSGEAVKNIEARLKQLRFKVFPGLKIAFKPNNEELVEAYRFGQEFAQALIDDRVEN